MTQLTTERTRADHRERVPQVVKLEIKQKSLKLTFKFIKNVLLQSLKGI